MKKELIISKDFVEISNTEAASIIGGGDIGDFLRCVRGTLIGNSGGAGRTFVLGITIWGMARMMGVMAECANL